MDIHACIKHAFLKAVGATLFWISIIDFYLKYSINRLVLDDIVKNVLKIHAYIKHAFLKAAGKTLFWISIIDFHFEV